MVSEVGPYNDQTANTRHDDCRDCHLSCDYAASVEHEGMDKWWDDQGDCNVSAQSCQPNHYAGTEEGDQ